LVVGDWQTVGIQMMKKLFVLAALLASFTIALAGCAQLDPKYLAQKAKADAAISKLQKFTLAGYKAVGTSSGSCSIDYCNPNASFSLSKTSGTGAAAECKAFIKFGHRLRVTGLAVDIDSKAVSLAKSPAQAQIACVAAMSLDPEPGINVVASTGFSLVGALPANSTGTVYQMTLSRSLSKPETRNAHFDMTAPPLYVVQVSTAVQSKPLLDPQSWADASAHLRSHASREALDLIGAYRFHNPTANPYNQSSLDAALKTWTSTNTGTKLEYVRNSSGQITRLRIAPKQTSSTLPLCVSIVKFDPAFFGVADPHTGYSVGIVKTIDDSTPFGLATTHECK
jgi:hypothetical protein